MSVKRQSHRRLNIIAQLGQSGHFETWFAKVYGQKKKIWKNLIDKVQGASELIIHKINIEVLLLNMLDYRAEPSKVGDVNVSLIKFDLASQMFLVK